MARNTPLRSLADILEGTLKSLHIDQPMKKYSVWEHWEEIVGRNIASKAQPIRVQDKTLIVGVISHTWMMELTHMKAMILKKMHEIVKNCPLQNIRFELHKITLPSSKK